MLNFTDDPSTHQVHLSRPDPTILSYGSSTASAPPQYIVHKWGSIPHVPLWLPAVSECIPVWYIFPQIILLPPQSGIPTLHPPYVFHSSPWSVCPTDGKTPPGPSTLPLLPTNYHCHTVAMNVSLTYIPSHRPVPLLLSFSPQSPRFLKVLEHRRLISVCDFSVKYCLEPVSYKKRLLTTSLL